MARPLFTIGQHVIVDSTPTPTNIISKIIHTDDLISYNLEDQFAGEIPIVYAEGLISPATNLPEPEEEDPEAS